jgi:hypothetical protein
MDSPLIGRLVPVAHRQVWPHEALDFTPWLLANSDVLSEVLALDLDLEAAEHPVGDFSLDLIGVDRVSGGRVIVENQLQTSDHTHLGQIMTYAAGTEASHIVWVAPFFRPEHRRALEWLNGRTDEETRFFAVQIDAVRIGDSPVAPLMTLVVQPNDWGKQVRASAVKQSSPLWTLDDLMSALKDWSAPVAKAVESLITAHSALGPGAKLYWGAGQRPSVTATMQCGAIRVQPWSVYSYGAGDGGPVWALNFDWIHKAGVALSAETTERVADELAALPGVSAAIGPAREAGWRKRPSIPAEPLFGDPTSVTAIVESMRRLYAEVQDRGSQAIV